MSRGFIIFLVVLLVLGVGFWLTKDYFFRIQEGNLEFAKMQKFQNENFKWESPENFRFKFSLYLPNRWENLKVEEKDNSVRFNLEHKTLGYREVFTISAKSKEEWKKMELDPINSSHRFKEEKNGIILVYALGQDDGGYVGFPEIVSNQTYKGPYYDVQNLIIPTFQFSDVLKSCKDDKTCPVGFLCYSSQYSAPSPESPYKSITGPQEGDLLCHKLCETDMDCGIRKCSEKRLFNGDAVEIKKFCD